MSTLIPGDVVKLGPTAIEKQHVLHVWGDGTVQVRQNTTGKVRNVQASRCVLIRRSSDVEKPQTVRPTPTITAEYAETHWCDKCGDFLTWCPDWRDKISPA